MKDRVIYTSLVGDIDELQQPAAVDPRYDYVCFVAAGCEGGGSCGQWQLRGIPWDCADPRMLSRYPKMHPGELFPNASWTLWMDANLSIRRAGFYSLLDGLTASGVQMAAPVHPLRDCIYDEAVAVVAAGKSDYASSHRVINFLRERGYPRHAGLFENNILLRAGGDAAVRKMDGLWWDCLRTLSGRDQLSLLYCAKLCGVNISPLLPQGMKVRDCELLEYQYHDRSTHLPWLADKWRGLRKRIAVARLQRELPG